MRGLAVAVGLLAAVSVGAAAPEGQFPWGRSPSVEEPELEAT